MPSDAYSHRNGETESPTEAGYYWLRGIRTLPHVRQRIRHLLHIVISGATCVVQWGGAEMPIDIYSGQWWGPELPPWETPPAPQPQLPTPDDLVPILTHWTELVRARIEDVHDALPGTATKLQNEVNAVTRWLALQQEGAAEPQPDWSDAPSAAMFYVVDPDGTAWWSNVEPYCSYRSACWCPRFREDGELDMWEWAGKVTLPLGVDWRTTLRQRPAAGKAHGEGVGG